MPGVSCTVALVRFLPARLIHTSQSIVRSPLLIVTPLDCFDTILSPLEDGRNVSFTLSVPLPAVGMTNSCSKLLPARLKPDVKFISKPTSIEPAMSADGSSVIVTVTKFPAVFHSKAGESVVAPLLPWNALLKSINEAGNA